MEPPNSEDQNMELLMSTLSTQKACGPLISAHKHSIQLTKTDFVRPGGNNLFYSDMYMFYPHLIPKESEIALGDILAYTIRAQALLSEWLPAYTVSCPVQ